MNTGLLLLLVSLILIFIIVYRRNSGENVYKYIVRQVGVVYDKYAPYSFKVVREKVKELGQEYTPRQYTIQVTIFAIGALIISYMYFYNLVLSIIYMILAISVIPYLTYLRCKRIYSEFIFEQIQVYTTNVIMEFATTQSFVKALEGVYESGVLEDPIKKDVKVMIDLAYEHGTIVPSIEYMNKNYDYYIVRNLHQLFYQITTEGSRDAGAALENMSLDIDMLVEGVYRDRMDRAAFHKRFVQFGIVLYLMVMLVQFLLGVETYIKMLDNALVQLLLHGIIIINTFFLLRGEKYYNEDVGAE
ncbi:MAG: hypothetical protein GX247_01365 [Mollicutes bacterium]|nr:hypothetical protein [Mollicutes bacterium]